MNKLFNLFFIVIIIYLFYVIYKGTNERKHYLQDNKNIRYTIGKVIGLEGRFGNLEYVFYVNNQKFKGRIGSHLSHKEDKSKIGKYFLVKYNKIKPKYNELLIKYKIPDSLTEKKFISWETFPKFLF